MRAFALYGLILLFLTSPWGSVGTSYSANASFPTPAFELVTSTGDVFSNVTLKGRPALLIFWAPWCNPCKMVAPILDKLAKEYEGKIIVAKVNTDENPEWMMKYGIQGIPTMLFVSNGKIVHRQVGALPERMLRDVVTQFMEVVAQS